MIKPELWTQKKLKLRHVLSMALYFLFAFVGPVVTTIAWAASSDMIRQSTKVPLIVIIIVGIFAIFACHFLKKSINKIQVLELDGSINEKSYKVKMILSFVCTAIVPIILIIGGVFAKAFLVSTIDEFNVYINIIMVCLGEVIASKLINCFLVEPMEFEIDLRTKVSEEQAIQRRVNNLSNINK